MAGAEEEPRSLTLREINLARSVFKNGIDYTSVKIHKGSFFPSGLQHEDTAITPAGEIYFMPKHYHSDYASASADYQHWFMHEMTHVWQHQLGLKLSIHGSVNRAMSYRYSLSANRLLCDYAMDAQANLLADYFWLKKFGRTGFDAVSNLDNARTPDLIKRYEWTIRAFLSNPSDKRNLPRETA